MHKEYQVKSYIPQTYLLLRCTWVGKWCGYEPRSPDLEFWIIAAGSVEKSSSWLREGSGPQSPPVQIWVAQFPWGRPGFRTGISKGVLNPQLKIAAAE